MPECKPTACSCRRIIQKGDFIAEYAGEIIHDNAHEQKRRGRSEYIFDLGNGFAVDAQRMGNPTRRMNHANESEANVRSIVVNHRGIRKVAMCVSMPWQPSLVSCLYDSLLTRGWGVIRADCRYAKTKIAAHTELSFNYGPRFDACHLKSK